MNEFYVRPEDVNVVVLLETLCNVQILLWRQCQNINKTYILYTFQLEYRMPLEIIQSRVLQATIWNHDTLQENEFLGGVSIPLQDLNLTAENIEWYTLSNIYR